MKNNLIAWAKDHPPTKWHHNNPNAKSVSFQQVSNFPMCWLLSIIWWDMLGVIQGECSSPAPRELRRPHGAP
eukprot:2297902-Amphidinium_carterae.1